MSAVASGRIHRIVVGLRRQRASIARHVSRGRRWDMSEGRIWDGISSR
jgi:ADP-glucose pyrophosphorylase